MADLIFVENTLEDSSAAAKLDEKRESLVILATLGMTKEYLGEELSADKIYKLDPKEVEKYFYIYQVVQGKKISNVLVEKALQLGVRAISHFLSIDDSVKLVHDLENDELVNRELSNIVGLFVLRGGRFVALASGLIQIANHIATDNILFTPSRGDGEALLQQSSQYVDNTSLQDVDNS